MATSILKRSRPAKNRTLEEVKAELHDLIEEVARRKTHETILNFFPDEGPLRRELYPKHVQFMDATKDYKELVVFGGNRCCAPDTRIDMADGPVLAREAANGSTSHVISWDGEKRCSAPMSGWFLKGFSPMYRVVLDNGQSFACTAGHRILAADGHFYALASLLGRTGGLRLWGKTSDFLVGCGGAGSQGGEPFRQGLGSGPAPVPSPSGAQAHTPVPHHEGAAVHTPTHIRPLAAYGPLSNHGDLRDLGPLFDSFSTQLHERVFQRLLGMRQDGQQLAVWLSALLRSGAARRGCQSGAVGGTYEYQHLEGERSFLRRHTLGQGANIFLSGCDLSELDRVSARDTERTAIFLAYGNTPLEGGASILAAIPVGVQPVLDATVDGTACYSAGGVFHHNSGKSLLGSYIMTLHLTGEYPHWWKGRRFDKPVMAIACGKEGKIVRDSIQKLFMGEPGKFGTGMIPARCLDRSRVSASRGASGLYDRIQVRHVTGDWSTLRLMSYDQGRQAFESTTLSLCWLDESCPEDVYSEVLMRTMTTKGQTMLTFTPLLGVTPLVRDLIKRAKEGSVFSIEIPWDDAPHIEPAMIEDMMKRYPSHEIAARRYGKPQLGSGAIFTADPKEFVIKPRNLPDHWPRIYGLDFGWTHPTAALWAAWDRESDVLYIYSEHRRSKTEMANHVAAINGRGSWIRGMSETAGTNISDGRKIYDIYKRDFKLRLKPADKSVEAGIMKMQQRLGQGGLKVFDTCTMFLSEYLTYHRVKGKINKEEDDLMDSWRYLLMGLEKYAKTKAEVMGNNTVGNVTEVRFGNWR